MIKNLPVACRLLTATAELATICAALGERTRHRAGCREGLKS
jgi:hypothetical protein